MAHGGDRADARSGEGRPSRLDRGAPRGCRAGRARRRPNAGKSSLLQALSQIQIKTGDYAFTTTRPIAAVTSVGGVRVQLVEIPGLLEGASEGRGGGRALLGVLRNADAIVYCHAASASPEVLATLRREVEEAGIVLPALLAATKVDEDDARVDRLAAAFGDLELVPVSVLDDASLERFREAVWRLLGLIRVYLRHGGGVDDEPLALEPGATVEDVADAIHHELAASFRAARIWGPSARFDGQRVGRAHVVADLDEVEILH